MSLYRKLLGSGSNVAVNKLMIKNIGLDAGFLFASLIDFENYLIEKEIIKDGDAFHVGRAKLEDTTTLSEHRQKQAEKILIENGLIEMKLKGVPARNHYKINGFSVLKIMENWILKNKGTRSEKSTEQDQRMDQKRVLKLLHISQFL